MTEINSNINYDGYSLLAFQYSKSVDLIISHHLFVHHSYVYYWVARIDRSNYFSKVSFTAMRRLAWILRELFIYIYTYIRFNCNFQLVTRAPEMGYLFLESAWISRFNHIPIERKKEIEIEREKEDTATVKYQPHSICTIELQAHPIICRAEREYSLVPSGRLTSFLHVESNNRLRGEMEKKTSMHRPYKSFIEPIAKRVKKKNYSRFSTSRGI